MVHPARNRSSRQGGYFVYPLSRQNSLALIAHTAAPIHRSNHRENLSRPVASHHWGLCLRRLPTESKLDTC